MTLPYERGALLPDTAADVAKLRAAWRIVARRQRDGTLYDFTGLERSLELGDVEPGMLDDDLAPALVGDRLTGLALEHMGGIEGRDDVFVANRLTAAVVAAMLVLVRPGDTVLGVSASYSHPVVHRAVRLAGGALVDTVGAAGFAAHLERLEPALVILTRLAVSYEALPADELAAIGEAAERHGVPVFVDDAGGARRSRRLRPAADARAARRGRRDRARQVRDDGAEARPPGGAGRAGGQDSRAGDRARARGAADALPRRRAHARAVRPRARPRARRGDDRGRDELESRLPWVDRTPVAVKLQGEDTAQATGSALLPYEATAALAMLLLRDHGILTVHFAALPPGTSALLLKFVLPETLEAFGGAARFAEAVESSLAELAELAGDEHALRELLVGRPVTA